MIRTLAFDPPEWDIKEIKRYAQIRGADQSYEKLIGECISEAKPTLSYHVCYTVLDMLRADDSITFGNITINSNTIDRALGASRQVLLFAATIGAPFDRLLHRYSRIAPSKALILQAIGAERVESLCDAFCFRMNKELNLSQKALTRRVSPGYGDIPLMMQKELFAVLDCPRKIGLTLDESLLMSPSKSVTAICGVTESKVCQEDQCSLCDKTDCAYRQ